MGMCMAEASIGLAPALACQGYEVIPASQPLLIR